MFRLLQDSAAKTSLSLHLTEFARHACDGTPSSVEDGFILEHGSYLKIEHESESCLILVCVGQDVFNVIPDSDDRIHHGTVIGFRYKYHDGKLSKQPLLPRKEQDALLTAGVPRT